MKHPAQVDGFDGSLADLARKLSDLRYDALAEFLRALATRIAIDSDADANRNRPRLAEELSQSAEAIAAAAGAIARAWRICAPHMQQ